MLSKFIGYFIINTLVLPYDNMMKSTGVLRNGRKGLLKFLIPGFTVSLQACSSCMTWLW